MRASHSFIVLVVAACASVAAQTRQTPTVLYEGARLITGEGTAPIERSAFLVENGRFTRVGRQGDVQAPAGRFAWICPERPSFLR